MRVHTSVCVSVTHIFVSLSKVAEEIKNQTARENSKSI